MTDVLDRQIKGLVAELVDAAPVPPPLGPVATRGARRPRRRAVISTGAVACLAAVVAVLAGVDRAPERRVELGDRTPSAPPWEQTAKPTFVVPSRLPAGFVLVGAGSDTSRRMGAQEIVFWSEDFTRGGRIVWGGLDGTCPPAKRSSATSQQQAVDAYRAAPASTGLWAESLEWCEPADHVLVTVAPGRGLSREETADLAEGIVRNGQDLSVRLPPRFTAVRTPEDTDLIRLLYRGPGAAELWVDIWGAGPLSLDRHRMDTDNPAAFEAVTLAGRPALKGDHFVSVLYDEHTLVDISSSAVAQSDLLSAAASLVPGDPSLPKPIASVPDLCKRLGMCG